MKKYFCCLFFLLPGLAFSQFENRLHLYTGIGIVPFKPDNPIQTETIFQGYRTTPFFHGFFGYALNRKLAMGGVLRQLITSKSNYSMSNTALGYGVKYNFLPFDKPISPFVYADLAINYTFLSQKQNTQVVQLPASNDPTEIALVDVTLQEPEIQLNIFPSFSTLVAVGAEFTMKRVRKKNVGLFIMGGYSISNTANQNNVKDNFPRNESKFNYVMVCAGARFSFLQRKSLY